MLSDPKPSWLCFVFFLVAPKKALVGGPLGLIKKVIKWDNRDYSMACRGKNTKPH